MFLKAPVSICTMRPRPSPVPPSSRARPCAWRAILLADAGGCIALLRPRRGSRRERRPMALHVPAQVFREYDIRGKADQHLSSDLVRAVGLAFASLLPERRGRVAVARDCRLSSPRIRDALVEGLVRAG